MFTAHPEHRTPLLCDKAGSLPPTSELSPNHVPHTQTMRTTGGALWVMMYERHSSRAPAQPLRRLVTNARTAHLGSAVVMRDDKLPPADTSSMAGAVFSEYQLEKCLKVAILCGLDVDVIFSVKTASLTWGASQGAASPIYQGAPASGTQRIFPGPVGIISSTKTEALHPKL